MTDRKKRGRLSSIDKLPAHCDIDISWAVDELNARNRTAEEIRVEFNARLAKKNEGPISKSAFNRYSVWLARTGRRMQDAREIASVMAEKLDEQPEGDVGLLLVEVLKTLVYDVVVDASLNDDSAGIKMLKEAAVAVQKLEQARATNIKTQAFRAENFIKEAADTAAKAARKGGLSAESARDIRNKVLGVRT